MVSVRGVGCSTFRSLHSLSPLPAVVSSGVFTSFSHLIHFGLWAFGCCGAAPTVSFAEIISCEIDIRSSFDLVPVSSLFSLSLIGLLPIAQSRVSLLSIVFHRSVISFRFHCVESRGDLLFVSFTASNLFLKCKTVLVWHS